MATSTGAGKVAKARGKRTGRASKAVLDDLGAHVSIAGGLEKSFARAVEVGARATQIFCKNQRQWKSRPLGDYEVGCFRRERRNSGVERTVIHGTYLVNLATEDPELRRKSLHCCGFELQCAAALDVLGVVQHPGTHEDEGHGIALISEGIEAICTEPLYAGSALLLETTAGQGNSIGWQLSQIEAIIRGLSEYAAERVGLCLDTAHLHAAGYDVGSKKGWDAILEEIEERIGLDRVRCIHVNDAAVERGSRVDRHANIGEGKIDIKGFEALMNEPRLVGVIKILETPADEDGHERDLNTLRQLVS
ncbi:MAG: deoxyribonuclease IV [Planctomycetota bacterium]|jgi:deoxyribonuclease-4